MHYLLEVEEKDYSNMKRSELPDEVFGIPQERKYPLHDKKHVISAIKLFNHVEPKYEEQLAKAIIKKMREYDIDPGMIGPNNRLRKYLPKDMQQSLHEANIIIPKKDIYYKFEEFEKGNSNIVLVLGVSGSGKTTLATQLAQQYNAELVSTDAFFYYHIAQNTNSELCKEWIKTDLAKEYMYKKQNKEKITNEYKFKYMEKVMDYIFKNTTSGNKRYIIEGVHIAFFLEPEEIAKYPLVIKETPMLTVLVRKYKRDGTLNGNIIQVIKWYKQSIKEIDQVKEVLKEFGTTAGTVVGSNQSADNVYIVNYLAKNAFNGDDEERLGICKTGMKDFYIKDDSNNTEYVKNLYAFKKKAKNIKMYQYTGETTIPYKDIIVNADSDKDFYSLLTNKTVIDIHEFLKFDSDFKEVPNFLDELSTIQEVYTATILSGDESLKPLPILTETVQGRPYNFFRDINGVFIMNEITKMRSKSYDKITDIPKLTIETIKKGYI